MFARSVIVILVSLLLITLAQRAFNERSRARVYDANGIAVELRR